MRLSITHHHRTGSVYLAVLGTSLVVSLLALSALALQRIQNRMLTASVDVQQAQLNAETAVQLGLLAMKQDKNWRTTHTELEWFDPPRASGIGDCRLEVNDADAPEGEEYDGLSPDEDSPVRMVGIGYSGQAEQRVQVAVDPRKEPLGCLRSAVAAGDAINLSGAVLRASNPGSVSANSISATSSTVYGDVKAVTIGGSSYAGTTQQVDASERPTMPDWSTAFNYYKNNGTQIDVNNLPTSTPNLGRNVGIENGSTYWTGTTPGAPTSTVQQSNLYSYTGANSLRVSGRALWSAGAAQLIDDYVKPGQQYYVEAWIYIPASVLPPALPGLFQITMCTKGSGGAENQAAGAATLVNVGIWTKLNATLTAPAWSGNLEYAYVKIAGAEVLNTGTFHVDDLDIRETTAGRFIYRQVIGPGVNPFGGTTNAQGIYWIDCGGNKLVIERSRIKGTLLVINPGIGSCIGAGPIRWSPAVAGYPALLVDADIADNADFSIMATNRVLSETENGVNFNPAGAPSDEFGQDADANDIYASEIQGLIAIEDDLTYQNNSLVRGQIVVGDDISASSGSLEVVYQPESLLNPPPGFSDGYTSVRRPGAAKKTVLP